MTPNGSQSFERIPKGVDPRRHGDAYRLVRRRNLCEPTEYLPLEVPPAGTIRRLALSLTPRQLPTTAKEVQEKAAVRIQHSIKRKRKALGRVAAPPPP